MPEKYITNRLTGYWSENGSQGKFSAIMFVCQRCKKFIVVPETRKMRDESDGNLQCYGVPEGWSEPYDIGVLCPDCTQALKEFLQMKEGTNDE